MRSKATYLFVFCLLILGTGITQQSSAQNTLGIVWDAPADTTEANNQLEQFSALGVTHIELQHPVPRPLLLLLNRKELTVLIRSGKSYLTISEIEENAGRLEDDYLVLLSEYRPFLNIAGFGLLSHGHTDHPNFFNAYEPITESLSAASNKSFYFFHQEEWYSFDNPQQPFGVFFPNRSYQRSDLLEFNSALRSLIATDSRQILFIHSSWLIEAVEKYPELSTSLAEYNERNSWEFPLPDSNEQGASANWMVLILLILWVALAIQVKYLPYVRPLIVRYYFAHRFYVDDILHYRERYLSPGILMMIKHAVFGGLVFYIVAQILFSEHGVQAFFHHLPWLAITGSNYFSFFFFGLILILLTQVIALFWLHLPAKTLEHISQTVNLYSGTFYIDFVIVTLMITLFTAEIGTSLTLILAAIYILTWFLAFNIAAYDASRNMGSGQILYLILTIGLHTALSLAAFLGLLLGTNFIEIVDLAISL